MQTKEFVQKQATLDELTREKDRYMAEFRKKALSLTSDLEGHLAEKKMQAKIAAMSPAEKQAMSAGLASSNGGDA